MATTRKKRKSSKAKTPAMLTKDVKDATKALRTATKNVADARRLVKKTMTAKKAAAKKLTAIKKAMRKATAKVIAAKKPAARKAAAKKKVGAPSCTSQSLTDLNQLPPPVLGEPVLEAPAG